MSHFLRAFAPTLAALLLLGVASSASAGGLYLSERGTRALGRGGAFVAGAEGLEAVGHNPAGLSGTGVLGELTLPLISASYRQRRLTDDGEIVRYVDAAALHGESELIPFPTLVGGYTPKNDRYTIAAGLITPNFVLLGFPNEQNGRPTSARYTLSGFTDSRILMGGVWARVKLHENLALGFGVHALVGTFRSTVAFSLSMPDRLFGAPEDPDYDAVARVNVGPMFSPSGSLGVKVTPVEYLAFGLSIELPMWLDSDSTFQVRLPQSPLFDSVEVHGNRARVSLRLPAIFRAGMQVALSEQLALEVAYVREFWSLHDRIDIEPDDIRISGIPGGPESLDLPRIRVPRGFRDASSFRGGLELTDNFMGFDFSVRVGIAYDQSAVPPEYLSLSSFDFNKWLITMGGGLAFTKRLRGDLAYVYVRTAPEKVRPEDARLTLIVPFPGNAQPEYVNGGTYEMSAHVLSGSLRFTFD